MNSRSKRQREQDDATFEKSWLLSYGDLFTLLFMILTVIAALYYIQWKENNVAVEYLNEQREQMEAELIRLDEQRIQMMQELERAIILDNSMLAVKEELQAVIRNLSSTAIQLEEGTEGIVIRIKDNVLFASGSAQITADGQQLLMELGHILAPLKNKIRIEGHTDNVPIQNALYASNWELSIARASSVLQLFIEKEQFPPDRFVLAGWGEHQPIATNDSPEGRAQNRRVEIVLLYK